MRLLSKQPVEPYGFTLYFLAASDELTPLPDLEAVENREWLWQRPYPTLELQHIWGSEDAAVAYRCHDGQFLRFAGLAFTCDDFAGRVAALRATSLNVKTLSTDPRFGCPSAAFRDPEGPRIWHLPAYRSGSRMET